MAPILTTLDQDTLILVDAAKRRHKSLEEVYIPRLRDCNGPLAVQQQLLTEFRESIEASAQEVEVCMFGMSYQSTTVRARRI